MNKKMILLLTFATIIGSNAFCMNSRKHTQANPIKEVEPGKKYAELRRRFDTIYKELKRSPNDTKLIKEYNNLVYIIEKHSSGILARLFVDSVWRFVTWLNKSNLA